MNDRAKLAVAFVVGLVVGTAAVGGVVALIPIDETRSPTASMTASTGAAAENAALPPSWIAQVPADDESLILFNYTYTHDEPSLDYRIDVAESVSGAYVVNVSATPADGKADPPLGRVSRTHIDAVASLPSDYDTVTVRFDGTDLATLPNPGSSVEFRLVNASR